MRSSEDRSISVLPGTTQQTPPGPGNILPPLSSKFPQWSRTGRLKVDVFPKPFPDSNKENLILKMNNNGTELSTMGRTEGLIMTPTADPLLRITQLEQNIKFLQEQHHLMLTSLHLEVEQLRQRNRDLQYQLVFSNGGISAMKNSPSPTSSSEDDNKPKMVLTPKTLNVTPLQVEILERDIAELKAALQESKTKNLYLSGIVEEQKKKLDSLEASKRELEAVGNKITLQNPLSTHNKTGNKSNGSDTSDLLTKLEEAENLIRRLRKENDDQKKELIALRGNFNKNGGVGGSRQMGGNGHRAGNGHHHRPQHQQSQSQRFPPLHSQSYWHHGPQRRSSVEYIAHRHCANRGDMGGNDSRSEKENQLGGRAAPSLPNLRGNAASSDYGYSNGNNHRRGHYNSNGNHYYRTGNKDEGNEGRKHRGGNNAGGGKGNRDRDRDRDMKQ